MSLSITEQEFNDYYNQVIASFSEQLGVNLNFIDITIIPSDSPTGRRKIRRNLQDGIDIEVVLQTHDYDTILSAVRDGNFAADLGARISTNTGLDVSVFEVVTPESGNNIRLNECTFSNSKLQMTLFLPLKIFSPIIYLF